MLQVVRCLLINPFPESALNDEAGKLFMEDFEEYTKKVHAPHDPCRLPAVPSNAAHLIPCPPALLCTSPAERSVHPGASH